MAKTIKWHEGVKAVVAKADVKSGITDVERDDFLAVRKHHMSLLARRAKLNGWKDAINALIPKNKVDMFIETMEITGENFLHKGELRKAANLVN